MGRKVRGYGEPQHILVGSHLPKVRRYGAKGERIWGTTTYPRYFASTKGEKIWGTRYTSKKGEIFLIVYSHLLLYSSVAILLTGGEDAAGETGGYQT
jgi:hypothetical protein